MDKIGNANISAYNKMGVTVRLLCFACICQQHILSGLSCCREFQASCYYMETGYTCDNALVFVNDRDRVKCAVYEPEHFTFTEGD